MDDAQRDALLHDLITRASEAGVTVGTAESCTGGLVCAALTDVPGSSAVVRGGIVSYAVPVKEDVLGVPNSITQGPGIGVVSSECAQAMSRGARRVLGCDIAVSTTGIAGPSGAEPGKPVGTVWFGIASTRGVRSKRCVFAGSRTQVREQAVDEALSLVLEELADAFQG
ncbi:MAG: CinA family protein [Atopobiaceae bacterium]|nr:CinA family protein [Atopobiaceae bacterium]